MAHYTPGGNFIDDHAETRMQERNVTDQQVDLAIQHGVMRPGNVPGRTEHHNTYNSRGRRMCLMVVTVTGTNTVVTLYRHPASRHQWP